MVEKSPTFHFDKEKRSTAGGTLKIADGIFRECFNPFHFQKKFFMQMVNTHLTTNNIAARFI